MANPQLTLLQKVVNKLRSEGKIKNDKDFAKKTGYSTGTVSPYLTGKIEPSYAFLKKVEEVFKISLNDPEFAPIEGKLRLPDPTEYLTEKAIHTLAAQTVQLSLLEEMYAKVMGITNVEAKRIVAKVHGEELQKLKAELELRKA